MNRWLLPFLICRGFVRFLPIWTAKENFQQCSNLPLFLAIQLQTDGHQQLHSRQKCLRTATLTGDSVTSLLFPNIPSRTLISHHNFQMFRRVSSHNLYIPQCRLGSVLYSAGKIRDNMVRSRVAAFGGFPATASSTPVSPFLASFEASVLVAMEGSCYNVGE